MKVTVLGPKEMEAEGMGALLAVARGTDEEPRFIVLEHRGGRIDVARQLAVQREPVHQARKQRAAGRASRRVRVPERDRRHPMRDSRGYRNAGVLRGPRPARGGFCGNR